jgi:hypothetical protein
MQHPNELLFQLLTLGYHEAGDHLSLEFLRLIGPRNHWPHCSTAKLFEPHNQMFMLGTQYSAFVRCRSHPTSDNFGSHGNQAVSPDAMKMFGVLDLNS